MTELFCHNVKKILLKPKTEQQNSLVLWHEHKWSPAVCLYVAVEPHFVYLL